MVIAIFWYLFSLSLLFFLVAQQPYDNKGTLFWAGSFIREPVSQTKGYRVPLGYQATLLLRSLCLLFWPGEGGGPGLKLFLFSPHPRFGVLRFGTKLFSSPGPLPAELP